MNILIDTHAWLWMLLEPERIGANTRALIADPTTRFHLSVASVWELAIKHAAGRVSLPEPPLSYVESRTRADGVLMMPIEVRHACRAADLPRHHGDPFDRLLVAQAELEGHSLLTHDSNIARYAVDVLDPTR